MRRVALWALGFCLLLACTTTASDEHIKSAQSAAPPSISDKATIMDWGDKVIRKGSNGWTCLPDRPDTPGNDPWCVNDPWLKFLDAYKNKKQPMYSQVGIAYMLQGDTPVSNTDPYATEPKPGDDWVEGLGPHLMILLPEREMLKSFPDDSKSGGPWVMWGDTPYAHLMIPLEEYPPKQG